MKFPFGIDDEFILEIKFVVCLFDLSFHIPFLIVIIRIDHWDDEWGEEDEE